MLHLRQKKILSSPSREPMPGMQLTDVQSHFAVQAPYLGDEWCSHWAKCQENLVIVLPKLSPLFSHF